MNRRFYLITGVISILIVAIIWIIFWVKTPAITFNTSDASIVSVDYFSNHIYADDDIDLDQERDRYFTDSAQILMDYKPKINQSYMSSTIGLSEYADLNFLWSSDLEHFVPSIPTIDLRDSQAQDLASVFLDKSAQQYVMINKEQKYDFYLSFSNVVNQSPEVIINGHFFSLSKVNEKYYKFSGYTSLDHQYLSIKPAEHGQIIDRVAFVASRNKSVNSENRVNKMESDTLKVFGRKIKINIPEHSFIFLHSLSNSYLLSEQFSGTKNISGVYFLCNASSDKSYSTVNLNQPMALNIITHSGTFGVLDQALIRRELKYFYLSIPFLISGLFLIFMPITIKFLRQCFACLKLYWRDFQIKVSKNQAELFIYLLILVCMLILRINNKLSLILSIPVFLSLMILFSIVFNRFLLKFISFLILLVTTAIIIFDRTTYLVMQRSLEYIIFLLLVIAAIAIIFLPDKKKQFVNKRINKSQNGKRKN